jgi:hypothetical protein
MHLFRSVLLSLFSSPKLRVFLFVACFASAVTASQAQSTFGTILGTVKDSTGAVVPGAMILLTNKGTTSTRTATSDSGGEFTLSNIEIGSYSLSISAPGFEKYSLPEIAINARESRRVEAALKLGSETQTVTVEETAQNVITTEVSNLAETKLGTELVSLPVAIYSRSTGSTSPIDTLTTEAGVQTDDSGNLDIMGATPALLSVTIDGISSVGVEYSGPINEMFPSFNSIEEIRVSESNNNAEFSGVADITTVSKAGSGTYHGGVFENLQNTAMNAGDPFQTSKTKIIMNDFGGTLGGPLSIPHLYNGRERSFFFASFEALRLPRETPIVASVPPHLVPGRPRCYEYLSAGRSNAGRPDERSDHADCGQHAEVPDAAAELRFAGLLLEQLPRQLSCADLGQPGRHPSRPDTQQQAEHLRPVFLQESSGRRGSEHNLRPQLLPVSGKSVAGCLQHPGDRRGTYLRLQLHLQPEAAERVSRRIQRAAHLHNAELQHKPVASADRPDRAAGEHRVV